MSIVLNPWAATKVSWRYFDYNSANSGIIGTTPGPIGRAG